MTALTSLPNPKDLIGKTKPSLTVIPPSALLHCGLAMMNGAEKYGAFNWRDHPVLMSIYIDASMRHLLATWDGEDIAEDSLVLHLAHTMACCAIMIDALEGGNMIDDRPKPGTFSQLVAKHTKTVAKELAAVEAAIAAPEHVDGHVVHPVNDLSHV